MSLLSRADFSSRLSFSSLGFQTYSLVHGNDSGPSQASQRLKELRFCCLRMELLWWETLAACCFLWTKLADQKPAQKSFYCYYLAWEDGCWCSLYASSLWCWPGQRWCSQGESSSFGSQGTVGSTRVCQALALSERALEMREYCAGKAAAHWSLALVRKAPGSAEGKSSFLRNRREHADCQTCLLQTSALDSHYGSSVVAGLAQGLRIERRCSQWETYQRENTY